MSLLRTQARLQIYLNLLSPSFSVWPESVKRYRRQWTDLSYDFLRAPDGSWLEGTLTEVQPYQDTSNDKPEITYDPLGNENEVRDLNLFVAIPLLSIAPGITESMAKLVQRSGPPQYYPARRRANVKFLVVCRITLSILTTFLAFPIILTFEYNECKEV